MSGMDCPGAPGTESPGEPGSGASLGSRQEPLGRSEEDDNDMPRLEDMRVCGNDEVNLLSLPWEMVTQIASHLPAKCIINVLPQVSPVLSGVSEDPLVWQQRAQRLVGEGARFPVGPRETLDWAAACLQMETLMALWGPLQDGRGTARQTHNADRERREERREEEGVQRREEEEGEEERRREGDGEAEGEGGERGGGEEEAQRGGGGAERRQGQVPDGEVVEEERQGGGGRERQADGSQGGAAGRGGGGGGEEECAAEEECAEEVEEEERKGGEEEEERKGGEEGEGEGEESLERFSLPLGHIADVHAVLLFGGRAEQLATGSLDRCVNLWDLRGGEGGHGRLVHTLGGHSGWVWCLAQRDNKLASGSFDSTVRLWDMQAGGKASDVITGRAPVICLSWQPEDNTLIAGSHDKKINFYDPRATQPLVKSVELHSSAVLTLAATDNYIISGGKDKTIALYDRRACKLLSQRKLASFLLCMSQSGGQVWGGDNRGVVRSFSLRSGRLQGSQQFDVGHTQMLTGIHCSPGALYTCSSDRTIKVHLPSAPPRTVCTLQNATPVNGLSVCAGVLAVASGNMAVEVWRPPH
ncbi:F-box/WD repeat-containing protein 9 [Engraulis encrasicolus]|uniref:F-box/WD repeat-containing protein 9 n=1 Tax=Engraulis encrasicolus TaxID=184585 RepID=UPI002FD233BC